MKVGNKVIEEIAILTNDNEVIVVISDMEIIENKDFKVNVKLAPSKDKLV